MASDCEKMAITTPTTEIAEDELEDDDDDNDHNVFYPSNNDKNAKKLKKNLSPTAAIPDAITEFPQLSVIIKRIPETSSLPSQQQQEEQQEEQQQEQEQPQQYILMDPFVAAPSPSPPPPPPPASPSPTPRPPNAYYNKFKIAKCEWADCYPGVQIACYMADICTIFPPIEFRLKCIKPIIQNGPTCGLVALSMLLNGPTDLRLLELAIENKFSNHGEMFSVGNMIKLMTLALQEKDKNPLVKHPNIQYTIHTKKLNCKIIRRALKEGACLLVPYDSDVDHTPCLKNGHKAHWALIVGYLINHNKEFYVFSRHGKTKHLALWPLTALSASNSNLMEMVKPSNYAHADFVIPYFGVDGEDGLNQKSIIIHGLKYKEMKLPEKI